ncbi:MAG TPA: hypothetical protein VKA46_35915 [Gemmataceae bacterium]|nr:hypothetical protein [Gemmataceae bacterium]
MTSWLPPSLLAAVLAVAALGPPPARAGEPKSIPAAFVPGGVKDRAYERYIDVNDLSTALVEGNAAALADCALLLAEGERVLLRPHKTIGSATVFRVAAWVAADNRDKETLARLGRSARERKKDDLAAVVTASERLAGQARPAEPSVTVALDEVSPEGVSLYQSYARQIRAAKLVGSKERLDAMETVIKGTAALGDKLKAALLKQVAEARGAVPDKADAEQEVLARLGMSSRGSHWIDVTLTNKTGAALKCGVSENAGAVDIPAGGPVVYGIAVLKGERAALYPGSTPARGQGYPIEDGGKYAITKDGRGQYAVTLIDDHASPPPVSARPGAP